MSILNDFLSDLLFWLAFGSFVVGIGCWFVVFVMWVCVIYGYVMLVCGGMKLVWVNIYTIDIGGFTDFSAVLYITPVFFIVCLY